MITTIDDDRCGELVALIEELTDTGYKESAYVAIISRALKVSVNDLANDTRNRKRELVYARQMHMLVRSKILGMSLTLAGSPYKKDHATVLHAIRTQISLYETNRAYRTQTAEFWQKYMADGGKV